MSKISQARALYAQHSNKTRLEIISIFEKQLSLARGTAAGYHDSIKKANKPAAETVKVTVAAAETVKVTVAAPAPAVVFMQSAEPKVFTKSSKRIAEVNTKPLHNFTKEEILEVLDPETRELVEKLLKRDSDARSDHTVK